MQNWSKNFHFQIKTKQISFNKRNKNNNIEDDRRSSRGWMRKNVVAAFFFFSSFCVLLSLFDKIKLNSKKSSNSDFVISSRKIWENPQQDTRLSSSILTFFFDQLLYWLCYLTCLTCALVGLWPDRSPPE